jgi:molybdopterin molybdotransferase
MSKQIASAPSCVDPFEPGMISLAQALEQIEQRVRPVLACERLPIRDCLNRVNNEAVKAPRDVPPRPNSAMDGYALAIASLAEDSITELEEIGSAFAGTPFPGSCGPGQCVRIMTGALIPEGADAVIMQEQAEVGADGKVRVDSRHRIGENIRQAGEDVSRGDTVI